MAGSHKCIEVPNVAFFTDIILVSPNVVNTTKLGKITSIVKIGYRVSFLLPPPPWEIHCNFHLTLILLHSW